MDLTHYRTHGYQVLRGVIDPGVAEETRRFLAAEAERATATLMSGVGCSSLPELPAAIDRRIETDGFDAVPNELRMIMSGHFPLETRLSPSLWAIPRDATLRGVVEEVLNHRTLFIHMPPVVRFILPRNRHAAVPPHQDTSYNKHMSSFVTAWVPLVPVDEVCGGVCVYEGSGTQPEWNTEERRHFWLKPVPTEGFRPVHHPMNPGDVLLLNPWIVHGSMPNRSDRVRYSIDYRFFAATDTSTKHYLDLQTGRVVAPGEKK